MKFVIRRTVGAAMLVAAGAFSMVIAAHQQPAAGGAQQKVVEVDKIKDNLYVLKGGGGNTAVFIRANSVVVVDTKTEGWGKVILAKIQELTPKPVATIINTHSHFDHVSGNVEFPATVEVIAQENLKSTVQKWPAVYGVQSDPPDVFKLNGGKNLPTKSYKDKMTVGSGNDRIDLFYFGRGHTGNDSWVVFPALGVVHAGDLFAGKSAPIMDANAGGSALQFPETLSKAYQGIKGVDTIITGHAATTMPWDDLRTFAEFNRDFVNAAREARKAGKSVTEFAGSWKTPEKYTGYGAAQLPRITANAQVAFDELSKAGGSK